MTVGRLRISLFISPFKNLGRANGLLSRLYICGAKDVCVRGDAARERAAVIAVGAPAG